MSTKEKDATAVASSAAPAGGDSRKKLAGWVGGKFTASKEAVKTAQGLEEIQLILNDYNLLFKGAQGALEAIGADAAVIQPLVMVLELNEADLTAAEKRLALEQELAL